MSDTVNGTTSREHTFGDAVAIMAEEREATVATIAYIRGTQYGDAENPAAVRLAAIAMMAVDRPDADGDGTKRLQTYCRHAVEYDLSDADAIRAIRMASMLRTFPEPKNVERITLQLRAAERRTKRGAAACPRPTDSPLLTCMAEVEPQEVDWLWPQVFGLGKINLICGDPGLGKSTLAIDMAAVASVGGRWPDGTDCPKGSVLLLTSEDGLADTVRPRLDRAGANCARVHVLAGVKNAAGKCRGFTLADVDHLRSALATLPDCKLVIIDPVSAYMSDKDSHNNAEVRGLLMPLADLAEATGVCLLLVTHLSKGGGSTKAIYRAMGSIAYVGQARAAYLICKDPNDDGRRLMLPQKNNIGNDRLGYAYRFVDGAFRWDQGTVDISADALLSDESDSMPGPKPEARRQATEWLAEMLKNGPAEVADLKAQAKAAGFSWPTVERAKSTMRIKAGRSQYTKGWAWRPLKNDDGSYVSLFPESPQGHQGHQARPSAMPP